MSSPRYTVDMPPVAIMVLDAVSPVQHDAGERVRLLVGLHRRHVNETAVAT